jgi:hypothetical protein
MKGKLGVLYVSEVSTGKLLASYMARGGPEKAYKDRGGIVAAPSQKDRTKTKGKDDHSTYRLSQLKPHQRWSAWESARIPYGAGLRQGARGFEFSDDGQKTWRRVPEVLVDEVTKVWGTGLEFWPNSDFGAIDSQVGSSAMFLHTTPQTEETYLAEPEGDHKEPDPADVPQAPLMSSHACIHIYPRDRDQMIAAGYLQAGVNITIHDYATRSPRVGEAQKQFGTYLAYLNGPVAAASREKWREAFGTNPSW